MVEAISKELNIVAIDAETEEIPDLTTYDNIIFTSGIDFGKFYEPVANVARKVPTGKKVYAIYTCASVNDKIGNDIKTIVEERGCTFEGKYGCKGYNTYGPWKVIGGMNKKHPSINEIHSAILFIKKSGIV